MAYYYVKNGGTATGDGGRYASQQTGSFAGLGAAGYYDHIRDAVLDVATTPPTGGDYIFISDLHSYSVPINENVQMPGNETSTIYYVCVDDANIDAARTSGNRGFEGSSISTTDITMTNSTVSGMSFLVGDDFAFVGQCLMLDCAIDTGAGGDLFKINTDGSYGRMENCEFTGGGTLNISNGGLMEILNTSFNLGGGVLLGGSSVNGGLSLSAYGCDMSGVPTTLIANVGADRGGDDMISVRMDSCKIAAGVSFTNETFKSHNQRALFTRCSDSSAAAEYQYHLHAFGGDVDDDAIIYRNEDEAFTESNQKISYKIVTNTDASLGSPLWLDFPINRYSRLSDTATDTLRFYLTSNDTLTDKDIYVEVSYPDGTNKQTPNKATSAPVTVGGSLDLLATGTTLTTDSTSTWTGGLTNKYQIDVSTAGDVGADCQPIVKVYITKPSTTIQLASEYGLV